MTSTTSTTPCKHKWKRIPGGVGPKGHLPPRQCTICGHVDNSRKAMTF